MLNLLSRLRKRQPISKPVSISSADTDLEAFFTDFEHLRDVFSKLVTAPTLPKRLLIIHGVGGAGKSTLLRMYRLYCKRQSVSVALASGDEAKIPVDVLRGFVQDLAQGDVRLPDLERTMEQYSAILTKVEREGAKLGKVARTGAKVAVEVAAGYVPIVGPVVAAVGGVGAEVFVDWLRGFLPKLELDLYLDPTARLTQDFVNDLTPIAEKRRLVLMLDTYEQMTGLDEWVRDLVQQLPSNVLTVIAGRATLGTAWDRAWPGWMAHARLEALEAMDEENMRTLVRRYYATMQGNEPNPAQVEEIIRFARGLPLVITSAVRLWVRYGVEDFRAVKPQVVADLVDRLMEGTPKEMQPALEAAAALRWFNKELLRALLPAGQVEAVYDELRRFPFVRSRVEGLALHDVVREMLDENLKAHDPEQHRTLHEKAAGYFEAQLEGATGDEQERLTLELLYHYFLVDEDGGTQLICQICEGLATARLTHRLHTVLDEVNSYPLERKSNKPWRDYYNARLLHLQERKLEAKDRYEEIVQEKTIKPRLKAYALCDLGELLHGWEYLSEPAGMEKAIDIQRRSLSFVPLDSHLTTSLFGLAWAYVHQGQWQKAKSHLEKAKEFFTERKDSQGLVRVYTNIKGMYANLGEWKEMFAAQGAGLDILSTWAEAALVKAGFLGHHGYAWGLTGRCTEAETSLRESLAIARQFEDVGMISSRLRDLGLVLGLQGKFTETSACMIESLKISKEIGADCLRDETIAMEFWGVILTRQGLFKQAKESLIKSLEGNTTAQNLIGFSNTLKALGVLHETQQEWIIALNYYQRSLALNSGQRYSESEALIGICRTKYHLEAFTDISSTITEAEQLAQQYEYNDHLASLRLTQGHIAWDEHLPDWGTGFEAALAQYQQALIYALRYNRFLLDETLWGGGVCTPLRPIIPHCLERGEEGRRMLTALRDWWQTDINDVGTPRPDTISPIPESIPLLEAERLAREREPGDGSPQIGVIEKIEQTLKEPDGIE